jgi:hypothetical protein
MCSPCNFLVEDYTEIFYTIYEGNIVSVQCKKGLRWSNSIGEVDCLGLFLIDFNVSLLTPGCHLI